MLTIPTVKRHKQYNKKYYKIVNSNYGNPNYKIYAFGLNSISEGMEIYFTDLEHIFAYLNYGPILLEIIIPENATVEYAPEEMQRDTQSIIGWYSDKIYVQSVYYLNNLDVIKECIANGADMLCDKCHLYRHALYHDRELWEYLVDNYKTEILRHSDEIFA